MNSEPVWFSRIKRYFVLSCSSCTDSVERLEEPRARVVTVNGDGLSESCIQGLPEYLTILSQEPTKELEIVVEYNDEKFSEVDIDKKHEMYDHKDSL